MKTSKIVLFTLSVILHLEGVVQANDRGVLGFFEKDCGGDWSVFTELKDNLVLGAKQSETVHS